MASELTKYAVAADFDVYLTKRAVTDQAVGADWTPAAGDVKVSKDGGAAANITTLPTAITMGNTAYWKVPLSATELTAARVTVSFCDQTNPKVIEDWGFTIQTYGNASAKHEFDLDTPTVVAASVTGNVGGNVTGSVGSVAAGGITASSIAADAIGASELAADAANEIADAILDRDMSTGVDSGSASVRTVRQALRFSRNKWTISGGTLTVKKEDDATTSWTAAVTTAAGNPVSDIDPA